MKPISIFLLLIGVSASPAAETPAGAAARTGRLNVSFAPLESHPAAIEEFTPAIVLPKFEVQDSRIKLSERDVLTSKELLAQARQRYLTPVYQKTFGQVSAALGMLTNLPSIFGGWHPNDAEASVLFAQDERLRRKRESEELVQLLEKTDPAAYKEFKQALWTTFRHEPLWRPRRID